MSFRPAPLSSSAERVLQARYLLRDAAGRLAETPPQLFTRVARALAEAERGDARAEWAERFFEAMSALEFLPNSPTLMNAGLPHGQLSACFVLPVSDSLESIFETLKHTALVQSAGGGTGFSFSALRPAGDPISSASGRAAGPLGFLRAFDAVSREVQQGGKRRGANMAVLRCDHPDVLELVRAKRDPSALTTFNLSIGVTDAFMHAVVRDQAHALRHPRSGAVTTTLRARELFSAIAQAACECGDPGLLFLDAIERANPTPALGTIEATNPCGEVPLLPYESCNLGSINLARMLRDGGGGAATIDLDKLRATTRLGLRLLDDVVDVSVFAVPAIAERTRATRKLGLGVMGFAEALVRMGISYDSPEAEAAAELVMRVMSEEAHATSVALADERGAFPAFASSRLASGPPLRNATRTAIAPTGTISILADTSASIEPLFALAYRRRHALPGAPLRESNPLFAEVAQREGADADRLLAAVERSGRLGAVADVPPALARLFVTAYEVPWERQLAIQAAFQRHVDNSVSKTINLSADHGQDDVARIFLRAFELGLKGITVFRAGSKPNPVLELGLGEEPYHREHGAKCDPGECEL